MRLRGFENTRKKHPGLEKELQKLQDYVIERIRAGFDEVVPPLAAEAIGLSNLATLGLLMALEDSQVFNHRYRVYCKKSDAVLLEVDDKDELPEELYCPHCNCAHTEEELDIEVVFKIRPDIKEQVQETAEVAQ